MTNLEFLLIRKKYKISQQEMAEILGVSQSYLSKIEKGNLHISSKLEKKMKLFFIKTNSNKKTSEIEKEIIETYDLIRNDNNIYSRIADINRILIDLNKELEEKMIKLDTLIINDERINNKIERPIKSTIKNLEKAKEKLENMINIIYEKQNLIEGE